MKITKVKLSKEILKKIELKVVQERKVAIFIEEAGIPLSSYYMAVNGAPIKSNHHDRIMTTLENY